MRYHDLISKGNFYRSRNGVFLGVCKGTADFFAFPVVWVRALVFTAFIFSGFFPIVFLYFIAALVMKPEPVIPFHSEDDQEFYNSYVYSRESAIHRLKSKFNNIERRIQRMEHIVTKREFDWDQKL